MRTIATSIHTVLMAALLLVFAAFAPQGVLAQEDPQDDLDDAPEIWDNVPFGPTSYSNAGFTLEPSERASDCDDDQDPDDSASGWWQLSPDENGMITAIITNYMTVPVVVASQKSAGDEEIVAGILSLWVANNDADPDHPLTEVACASGNGTFSFTAEVTDGETYYLRIADAEDEESAAKTAGGGGQDFELEITFDQDPEEDVNLSLDKCVMDYDSVSKQSGFDACVGSVSIPVGGQTEYTISVTNTGPGTARGVTVNDDLPSGVTTLDGCNNDNFVPNACSKYGNADGDEDYLSVDDDGVERGTYNFNTGIWVVGDIEVNQTVYLTIPVQVADVGEIENEAQIEGSQSNDIGGSNSDSATINGIGAELSVVKELQEFQVSEQCLSDFDFDFDSGLEDLLNQFFFNFFGGGCTEVIYSTFKISVRNNGGSATQFVLIDEFSENFFPFIPGLSGLGVGDVFGEETTNFCQNDIINQSAAKSDGNVGFYDFFYWVCSLAPGETAMFEVTVQVPADGDLINRAEVIACQDFDFDNEDFGTLSKANGGFFCEETLPDPNPENNRSAASAVPRRAADLVPGQGPGGTVFRPGNRFGADLSIDLEVDLGASSKTAGHEDEGLADDEALFTVHVTNNGPQTTNGVEVELTLPMDCIAELGDPETDKGTASVNGVVHWDVGQIKDDETFTLSVLATLDPACEGEELEATAEVTRSNLSDPDDLFFEFGETEEDSDLEETVTFTVPTGLGRLTVLEEAYPNPFNPTTVIPFTVEQAGDVRLAVYDLLGRRVALLVDGPVWEGRHEARFDAAGLPTGTYLVRLEAAGKVQVQRVMLMK